MRIVITGGGTGGHVFPALEVAAELASRGGDVLYMGSKRGQEGRACALAGIAFAAFPSEPLYRLTTPRGLKGAINLARSSIMVRRALLDFGPAAVFSTGGYSSAPVIAASRKLRIPYVIHEQNTVPGRTNRILSRNAYCVATTFRSGAEHFPHVRVVRTGVPLRKAFRTNLQGSFGFAQTLRADAPILLVMGGSQGAAALNDVAMATAVRMARTNVQWLHVTGPKNFEGMVQSKSKLALSSHYELRAYLESDEMAAAMFSCSLGICRSGAGTLAELAAYRKPAILVPYPQAFANHQYFNAKEFEEMGAATILAQTDAQPSSLEARILMWQEDRHLLDRAQKALAEWDLPNSAERIADLVVEASETPVNQR